MTTTFRSRIRAELAWTWTDHVDTLPIVDSNRARTTIDLPDGNEAGQADAVWHAAGQSLSAGQSIVYELDQLSQDLFGSAIEISMDIIKAVLVINTTPAGGGDLLLGGAATEAWEEPFAAPGDQIIVPPSSPLLLTNTLDGWLVPAGQTDLKLQAVDASVTYDIAILGTLSTSQQPSSTT